jgi:hypothetical protein
VVRENGNPASIGETALQRAAEINATLVANDRVKYILSFWELTVRRQRSNLSGATNPKGAGAWLPSMARRQRDLCG